MGLNIAKGNKTRYKNIKGQRFGRLIALSFVGHNKSRIALWLCQCDCGNKKIIQAIALSRGSTRSCGCLFIEMDRTKNHRKHGES